MPDSNKIFKANEQLDNRFEMRLTMPPFKYEKKEEILLFRTFLKNIDEKLPFADRSNLADPKLASKLYYASYGITRTVIKIIRRAAKLSAKHGKDFISEDYLQASFSDMEHSIRPYMINPFGKKEFILSDALEIEINKMKKNHEIFLL